MILIAGGGTGGHTSPGLAVAALLGERGIPCAWIGSRDGVEARLVPERGIPYFAISTGKLRRYWSWRNVRDLAVGAPAGLVHAALLLGRLRPRVVFATGGFVALPVVIAAALRRIPVVAHEQTAVPGLANRVAARFARRIALSFPDSDGAFPAGKSTLTGNPLRPELRAGSRAEAVARLQLDPALPLLYVTGSSLPSTLTSISRARTPCSTMSRRSWRAASSSAAGSAAAVATLLIPTLEPRFEGFTKQG